MADLKFFRCKRCGKVVLEVVETGVVPTCCGEPMELLVANATDGAHEKHVPAIEPAGEGKRIRVSVGEVIHPMLPNHYIQLVAIARGDGTVEVRRLSPGDEPVVEFCLHGCEAADVYELCNLHGLWKASYPA